MNVTVVRAGFLTTVQDLGRIGFRQFGVSSGGALDLHAMRVANFLAGNEENAAGLELTQGNVRLRFDDERAIAWCGGEYDVRVASHAVPAGHCAIVPANNELLISGPRSGCRAWLAISGGIDTSIVLGSRATDLRAQFGGFEGRALRDGDQLPLGKASRSKIAVGTKAISSWSAPVGWTRTARENPTLRVVRGAGWRRFDNLAIQRFTSETFNTLPDSDRMGVRLDGPELKRSDDVDLISEAVAPGTIQVPPSGKPILLLGDCQTIGGYPKIAHVITVDLGIAAQLRPGDRVCFSEVPVDDAHQLLLERALELERFRVGLSLHNS